MSDLLWQGLTISIVGLGLTFFSLGLLVLVTTILERLTRREPSQSTDLERGITIQAGAQSTKEDDEVAAAIAVALAHCQASDTCPNSLGASLGSSRSLWWIRHGPPAFAGLPYRACDEKQNFVTPIESVENSSSHSELRITPNCVSPAQ